MTATLFRCLRTCQRVGTVESNVELLTSAYDETTIIVGVGVVLGAVGREVQIYGLYVNSVK